MFITVLDELLKEKNIPAAKMLEDCKIGKNQYTYWKKNNNIPNGSTLQKLANYFNVTVDYLLGKEETKKPDGVPAELWEKICADPAKLELAKMILDLPDEELEYFIKVAKTILERPKK